MAMMEFGVRRALREGERAKKLRRSRGMELGSVTHFHLDMALALFMLLLFLSKA